MPTQRMALALAFVAAAIAAAPALAQLDTPLSSRDRRQLARGETVMRQVQERRGPFRLMGGTSFQVVDLPPEAVWAALNDDARRMRHMLPQVRQARQLEQQGAVRVIRFDHRVGVVEAGYTLRFEYYPSQQTVVFRLDDRYEHDLRAAWGFMRLLPWDGGTKTHISFCARVDNGDG
ncbi:MAG: SRPBCC family protein, partial [Myxococcota bacterium]